jgi:hypothetical protein
MSRFGFPSQMAQQNDPPREGVSYAWSSILNFDASITDEKTYDEKLMMRWSDNSKRPQPRRANL